MQDITDVITYNLKKYPELEYYIPLIEKADKNVRIHPDISIETSKSLLEGISKTIIKNLSPDDDLDVKNILNKMDMSVLIKKCMKCLSENDDEFEVDFSRASASLAYSLGALRNARGDISHGKIAPKELQSSVLLAQTVVSITKSLLTYMLVSFFRVMKKELDKIEYDECVDFNDLLDEIYPLEGKPLYSKALYDQYYEDYVLQLNEFLEKDSLG